MKKKLLFLGILVLIGASYCYTHRDMFRKTDTFSFGNTPVELQKKIRVVAFTTDPKKVEYINGVWIGDGNQGQLVYDGKTNFGLAKEYSKVRFYITVDDKFFSYAMELNKPDSKDSYDYLVNIVPKDSTYRITGQGMHLDKKFMTFDGGTMLRLTGSLKITFEE